MNDISRNEIIIGLEAGSIVQDRVVLGSRYLIRKMIINEFYQVKDKLTNSNITRSSSLLSTG